MNLTEYIKNNEVLSKLDFMTVYLTVKELIKDDKAEFENVQAIQ